VQYEECFLASYYSKGSVSVQQAEMMPIPKRRWWIERIKKARKEEKGGDGE
jgi:hypothetical protein